MIELQKGAAVRMKKDQGKEDKGHVLNQVKESY